MHKGKGQKVKGTRLKQQRQPFTAKKAKLSGEGEDVAAGLDHFPESGGISAPSTVFGNESIAKQQEEKEKQAREYRHSMETKRIVREEQEAIEAEQDNYAASVICQFVTEDGETSGPQIDIPLGSTQDQLEQIINQLLENGDNPLPYSFFVTGTGANGQGNTEVEEGDGGLASAVKKGGISTESIIKVVYQPQAVFRVRPVTRCTDTMPGHSEAVLHVSFSPCGTRLASGGGDATVRFWNASTSTPWRTCKGHKHWVLCTAWSPDGLRFASADKNGEIRLWDPKSGTAIGRPMKQHKQWVTALAWQPLHRTRIMSKKSGATGEDGKGEIKSCCELLASASKDCTIKIWQVRTGRCMVSLSGHTNSIESIKWGGQGLLYSASRDRTVKVWSVEVEGRENGKLVRSLEGHGHRVNALALNTEYACRTGFFDHSGRRVTDYDEARSIALQRYDAVRNNGGEGGEVLVSCSDDFTIYMWRPETSKKHTARLTGHCQPVTHMSFSPDGRYMASGSFDKKVKVWCGRTGKFLQTLIGHVGRVYQVCWSPDSRMLVSASADSSVKLWDGHKSKKAVETLPGHADEVYALDWSPNGNKVASGSKDRTIKIWSN